MTGLPREERKIFDTPTAEAKLVILSATGRRISADQLKYAVNTGHLEAQKFNGRYYFNADDLLAWAEGTPTGPRSRTTAIPKGQSC